jgi:crotonobetainyl-CoA:carnitine CoA-transferase CaiB-like acyl-CoA transferase
MSLPVEKSKNKSTVKGGARPGAGRKKGGQNRETKERRLAERELVDRIINVMHPILDAQISQAKGASYVYRLVKTADGLKHFLVTDPEEIKAFLDAHGGKPGTVNDSYYMITTKTPELKAIDSLLDRAFGKPRQTTELELPKDVPFNITIVQKK